MKCYFCREIRTAKCLHIRHPSRTPKLYRNHGDLTSTLLLPPHKTARCLVGSMNTKETHTSPPRAVVSTSFGPKKVSCPSHCYVSLSCAASGGSLSVLSSQKALSDTANCSKGSTNTGRAMV